MTAARRQRLTLGEGAVLAPAHAAELLPFRTEEALDWLRTARLVRTVWTGERSHEVVIWGDVLEAIKRDPLEGPGSDAEDERGTVTQLPRYSLGGRRRR